MRRLHLIWPLALSACTLAAPLAVRGEDASATAQEVVRAISADEAAHPAGRVSLELTEYRGEYQEGEKLADTRRRLSAGVPQNWEGSVTYRPDGWLKDLAVTTAGRRGGTRTRTVQSAGILRVLVEATRGEAVRRQGLVLRASTGTPADLLLTRHVGQALAGIDWSSAKPEGGLLRLEGKRGTEKHTLLLRRGPVPEVRSWTLVRHLEGPDGQSLDQRYTCEATPAETPGLPAQIEETVLNPPPSGNVAVRTTRVIRREPLGEVPPDALRLVFPKGTMVTDNRGDVPVTYELAEEGLNDAEVAAAVQALSKGHARLGEAAPPFTLPDTQGKPVELAAYRDRVLVLFWFSTRSHASDDACEGIQELARRFGKEGVQFVGVSVADEGGGSRAESYRSRFKWSFPVLLDPNAETLRHYGVESGVPKVAVVDRSGKIAYVRAGFDADAIGAALESLK